MKYTLVIKYFLCVQLIPLNSVENHELDSKNPSSDI
jgi:hypothetical protein